MQEENDEDIALEKMRIPNQQKDAEESSLEETRLADGSHHMAVFLKRLTAGYDSLKMSRR